MPLLEQADPCTYEPKAWEVHEAIQSRLETIDSDLERYLGITPTELQEVAVPGPHRLLVLDESAQPTGNFKYNGAAYAVHRLLQRQPDAELFFTGTAGNFGAAYAAAVRNAGRRSLLLAPHTLTEAKRSNMERNGGEVHTLSTDVLGSIALAETLAGESPIGAFIHPFNDLDAIAGQALVGRRIVKGLKRHEVQGPTEVLIQRGGGSLLSGIASVLRAVRIADLSVHEVRPERVDGELDLRYDGLAVEAPGSFAAALIHDQAFVKSTVHVSEADTGRAAHRMARALRGKRFEPSGLAGVAAFESQALQAQEPTTFIAVLSGANVSAEAYADIADAPRREQSHLLASLVLRQEQTAPEIETARANRTWSSPTAAYRRR